MRPPESWSRARGTLILAAVTAAAWLLASVLGRSEWIVLWAGFIPARLSGADVDALLAPIWLTPLTATLAHAGIAHLLMNLLMLLFCGRSVENILGTRGLLILYAVGAYAAAAAHYATGPNDIAPMVGASGSISAVLGAYAIMFGRNRVKVADPRLALLLNALWLAAAWVLLQLLVGLTFETQGARIAVAAHVGGFLAGLALAKPLLILRYRNA
ncbi:MAG TPA: rhomboid family intramembrane serine protease [Allosphingosinicella sp.]|jgi:membrane associated rhomboid family serine protease|uniref:rhomboid family intramembrane serine protease n=1 Tax=Allosphingosinicella sp. TaxID=2823234 RepID=UPI002F288E3D